jgi:hypothetical protein
LLEKWPKKNSKVTTKLSVDTNWISSLQLSLWDNISGPKVEQVFSHFRMLTSCTKVWTGVETLSEEVQMYVARHTLCGEIVQNHSENHMETKFHVFSDFGIPLPFWSNCLQRLHNYSDAI